MHVRHRLHCEELVETDDIYDTIIIDTITYSIDTWCLASILLTLFVALCTDFNFPWKREGRASIIW